MKKIHEIQYVELIFLFTFFRTTVKGLLSAVWSSSGKGEAKSSSGKMIAPLGSWKETLLWKNNKTVILNKRSNPNFRISTDP